MFVDLEGDPFAGDLEAGGGHQYLFGFVTENGASGYQKRWSFDAQEERKAFEWLVDAIEARQQEFPGMHVFHFGVYEPSKFRYLMGRYATRQEQIDGMLRAGVFVDLHLVLTEAVRASVEEYTLKKIEAFYGFKRTVSLEQSRAAMRYIEHPVADGVGRAATFARTSRRNGEIQRRRLPLDRCPTCVVGVRACQEIARG